MSSERASRTCSTGSRSQAASVRDPAGVASISLRCGPASLLAVPAEHARPRSSSESSARYREWTPSRTQPGRWEAESPRWPSAAVVCALYGAWNAALQDAGAGPRTRRWTDDAVRAALAAFWARTGRPPTAADLAAPAWDGPHARTLRRRYGSLQLAWDAVGPVPAEPVAPALEALSR